jgi:hypothetical protein
MRGCAALDDASIVVLSTLNQSSLTALNISSVPHLTSHTFRAVARCARLQALDLSMCRSITNDDLVEITAGCRQLQTLYLQGCVNIDDTGLAAIAKYCVLLERLSVEFCYNVTDVGFSMIISHCQRLEHLNVKACNQLTAMAFKNLVRDKKALYPLKTLDLGACAGNTTTYGYAAIVKQKFPRCKIHAA